MSTAEGEKPAYRYDIETLLSLNKPGISTPEENARWREVAREIMAAIPRNLSSQSRRTTGVSGGRGGYNGNNGRRRMQNEGQFSSQRRVEYDEQNEKIETALRDSPLQHALSQYLTSKPDSDVLQGLRENVDAHLVELSKMKGSTGPRTHSPVRKPLKKPLLECEKEQHVEYSKEDLPPLKPSSGDQRDLHEAPMTGAEDPELFERLEEQILATSIHQNTGENSSSTKLVDSNTLVEQLLQVDSSSNKSLPSDKMKPSPHLGVATKYTPLASPYRPPTQIHPPPFFFDGFSEDRSPVSPVANKHASPIRSPIRSPDQLWLPPTSYGSPSSNGNGGSTVQLVNSIGMPSTTQQ